MEADQSELSEFMLTQPYEGTLLEDAFPFREVSLVIGADRRANDPTYGAHRWWARRPPALLRAILMAASLPAGSSTANFWELYGSVERPLTGWRVLDPFIGGGSTLVEAARLGASVSGGDVDPLAVAIVRYELRPAAPDAIREAGAELLAHLRTECGTLYPSKQKHQPLHYFWLHQVTCPACQQCGLLYRNLVIARDRRKPGAVVRDAPLTVFCPEDLSVHQLDSSERRELRHGGRRWRIDQGTYVKNRYVCPACGGTATHKDLVTGRAPRVLLAVEETVPGKRRIIRGATNRDRAGAELAVSLLAERKDELRLPSGALETERNDERPLAFGMTHARDLFSDRQLAVFGSAFSWLSSADLAPEVRAGIRLALSNALGTNNKLCSYAHDYGRLSALFSVRGYSLPALPVELNPLHPEGGRGTIRQCIERVARAGTGVTRRHVWSPAEEAVQVRTLTLSTKTNITDVRRRSASVAPSGTTPTADLCLFDPPYFDYIAYSELSEFYRSWLRLTVNTNGSLLPRGDDPGEAFGLELGVAFRAALSRLHPGRPLAFTYHSTNPEAWRAIGIALDEAKVRVTGLWPVYSDGHMGHHSHPGNCEWDLVLVCRRISETVEASLTADVGSWARSAKPLAINEADRVSMKLALETADSRYGVPAKES